MAAHGAGAESVVSYYIILLSDWLFLLLSITDASTFYGDLRITELKITLCSEFHSFLVSVDHKDSKREC